MRASSASGSVVRVVVQVAVLAPVVAPGLVFALALAGCRGASGGEAAPAPSAAGATAGTAGATSATGTAGAAAHAGPAGSPAASAAPPVASSGSQSTYHGRPVTDGHAVEVHLSFAGKPRPAWPIPATFASHCGGATQVSDPSLVTDGKGGVDGAVVWLDDVHEGAPLAPAATVIEQKGCAFAPHVTATTAGSRLSLTNDDPANHAVRLAFLGASDDDSVVKMIPPHANVELEASPAWAGRVGRITCPIHPWMSAWVHFFDHPYFAVTAAGVARLANVPSGTWHLSVWHEAPDAKFADSLTQGPPVTARFEVTVKDRDVVRALKLSDDGRIKGD